MTAIDTDGGLAAPTLRATAARRRAIIIAAVALVVGAVVIAVVASGTTRGSLDPDATDPSGSRAVAELLRDQGISVTRVTRADDVATTVSPGTTLVVVRPSLISAAMLDRARQASPSIVVLIEPDDDVLSAYLPDAATVDVTGGPLLDPACDLPLARRAGNAGTGGTLGFLPPLDQPVTGCYPQDRAATLIEGRSPGGSVVLAVGSGRPFTNGALADDGNASLALGVLGRAEAVVWWVPGPGDPLASGAGTGQTSIESLLPAWVPWALVQLAAAIVLLAVWRMRRLGRVVSEPLPVVVRASETVEGRGRLYHRAAAYDRAAAALRAAAAEQLAGSLGLPRAAAARGGDDILVTAVASRTGRTESDVAALLVGPSVPSRDADLVAFADDLDALVAACRDPAALGDPAGPAHGHRTPEDSR